MSYSLSVSGHIEDAAVNEQVRDVLVEKGSEVVEARRGLGALGDHPFCSTSGPGWSINLIAEDVDAADG